MATLITGATGFVGQHILKIVDQPIITSRNRARATKKLGLADSQVIEWDPMSGPLSIDPSTPIDCVINLMGESVAEGRWSQAKKGRIRDSRVTGTTNLIAGLRTLDQAPSAFVSASAVGIYGTQGDTQLTENSSRGEGFLADVCQEWENAAMDFSKDGVRVAMLRVGIVLGKEGGALEKMTPIFKLGIGGTLGNGKQYVPWIHVTDLANLFVWAGANQVTGAVNATAPNPVTNRELTKTLGKLLHRPTLLPAPAFALKLALGEFGSTLLFSQRVIPELAMKQGFEFQFAKLENALTSILET